MVMVSIVMPVHNAGEYLYESIGSIMNQTYEDFELICVDDASDDGLTERILHGYAEKDSRIRLIFLEQNAGAAEARNTGMQACRGEYVIFLDADDLFDKVMIEKMYECILNHNADLCICGHRLYSDVEKKEIGYIYPVRENGVTDRVFRLSELKEEGLAYWTTAPWNKMCRRSFLIEKKIAFQPLHSSNDVFFSCMCSICAERIVYCQGGEPLLDYRFYSQNQISASRNPVDFYRAVSSLLDSQSGQMNAGENRQIQYLLLNGAVGELKACRDEKQKKECYDLVKEYVRTHMKKQSFDSEKAGYLLQHFREQSYENRWFEGKGNFYAQIREKGNRLSEELDGKTEIVIWGNGMRGNALQRLLREKGMDSVAVTDIRNENLGKKTPFGYRIINTGRAEDTAEVIIAANKKIYEYLRGKQEMKNRVIINLETYCPLE